MDKLKEENVYEEVGVPLELGEARIVWTEEIDGFDYVREKVEHCLRRRTGLPFSKNHYERCRVVGYSELLPTTKSGPYGFKRRLFLIKTHDRFYEPGVVGDIYQFGSPLEGVEPSTVEPNVKGRKTPRSEGLEDE